MSVILEPDIPCQGNSGGDAWEAVLPVSSQFCSGIGHILVPGRPQARQGSASWEEWRHTMAARAIETLGPQSLPLQIEGFIQLHVELYYAIPDGVDEAIEVLPTRWAELHIPRGSIAADSALIALSGILYSKRGQVQPLAVSRFVMPRAKLITRFGSEWRYGGTVLHYAI